MKIAFLLYPTEKIKPKEDSSFWIMHELARRGHSVFHFESRHLMALNGSVSAYMHVSQMDPRRGFLPTKLSPKPLPLSGFDAIFIRKEPPFDTEYLYAMQLLQLLREKVFILNDPQGISLFNEKTATLYFESLIPETLVTQSPVDAKLFIQKLKTPVVVKPLDQKAGSGILTTHPKDKNLSSILDVATAFSSKKVMIQRFVTSKNQQDRRILILGGEILGVFSRCPAVGDFRSNLSVGGSMQKSSASLQDRRIVHALAPTLLKNGLYFVGIDVLGDRLIEINVTSPSGIPEINALSRVHLQKKVADFIQQSVARRRSARS